MYMTKTELVQSTFDTVGEHESGGKTRISKQNKRVWYPDTDVVQNHIEESKVYDAHGHACEGTSKHRLRTDFTWHWSS